MLNLRVVKKKKNETTSICIFIEQTGSRNAFRTQFPNSPVDLDSLEIQQRALINHQEKTLQKIRQKGIL